MPPVGCFSSDKHANVDRGNPFFVRPASPGPRLAGRRDTLTPHQRTSKNVTRPRQRAPGVGDGRARLGAKHRRCAFGVAANAGVVTLTGHVQSFPQKVAAERAAARVKGVQAVAEEIEVKLPYD